MAGEHHTSDEEHGHNEHGHDDHHHHHGRFRFDEPYFGPDDANPIMYASIKDVIDANLMPEDRGPCAHIVASLEKCQKNVSYMPWGCPHERHALHICHFEDFKRRHRLKIRQDLGDDFANHYMAKKEEMYQHQKLLREVAQLVEKKEKLDKANGKK